MQRSELSSQDLGDAEEVKEEEVDFEPDDDEVMPPDNSPEKDEGLHGQGIWGQVETPFDPKAFQESTKEAAASAEAENEKAFANMEEAWDKKDLVDTEEFKYFRDLIFYQEERGSPLRLLVERQNGYSMSGLYHTGIRDDPVQAFKSSTWRGESRLTLILSRSTTFVRIICSGTCVR